jgi:hypothetical protein
MDFPNLSSIEAFYQEQLDAAGPFADCVEAKETWWEYNQLIEQEVADELAEKNIPKEIYTLNDSW